MADSRETLTINAFVVGYPIKHSRSPIIHSYWLKKFGIAGSYKAVEIPPDDFANFIATLKQGKPGTAVGGNVTIPHKEAAYRLADRPDALAEELGAANTVWMEEGELHATNTDGYGFVSNLDERHPGWDRTERAVVLGAGGASRAVIQSLRDRGIAEIHVLNRTVERARQLADRFGSRVFAHPQAALHEVMQGAGIFVNTTSLGMDGTEAPHIDFSPLADQAVVTDIVYVPLKTPILRMAEEQGVATVDGLGMLLHQAKPGFKRWFGKTPEVDEALRSLIIEDMEKH
ncbi:shikimate dehydrogenase [Agrobacterium tumefaciens]|uniref:Shikimate dehydrogenase (NADP(+)) n=1 Tax=Agrobacterium tumefaciens TaxID=358 RepID=A0A2L2L6T5_AGRTU|nr:shikimate dehydrogenase [Agrobacterium tumefaciens]AVH40057.1 shikimate 5-dehydrogenase [Agrobacterium tumefaciens]NSY96956.1 shikimate dehydrogenase [Agrobacterium tumefaciens]NSZ03914.1 shikimate dehydrogenase [Agrobacterium tumefaciens]NSZ38218.1 shikimate dehydrogenase [Agrobacterium tumefaciens]NTB03396.1 shikimate dehydrogenase [Agrobacterium tumefaciens]